MLKLNQFLLIICFLVSLLPHQSKTDSATTDNDDIEFYLDMFRDVDRNPSEDIVEKRDDSTNNFDVLNDGFEDYTENYDDIDDLVFLTQSTDINSNSDANNENNKNNYNNNTEGIVEENSTDVPTFTTTQNYDYADNYNEIDIAEQKERERLDRLCDEIINCIKTQNVIEGDKKIYELGINHTRIQFIVYKLYSTNTSNFELINNYALATDDPVVTFHIIGALWNIILSRHYFNFDELCTFYTTLTKKVINSTKIDRETSDYVDTHLRTIIGPHIADTVTKELTHALENNSINKIGPIIKKVFYINESLLFDEIIGRFNYNQTSQFYDAIRHYSEIAHKFRSFLKDPAVRKLNKAIVTKSYDENKLFSDQLYSTNKHLYEEIVCTAIDYAYNDVRFANLVYAAWLHETTPQKAIALKCIFEKLSRNLHNNGQSALVYAYYYNKLRNLDDYDNLKENEKNILENYFEKLPHPIKLLYSNEEVCIRNIFSGDYLGVGKELNGYKTRHHAVCKKYDETTKWRIIQDDEYRVLLQNGLYSHEYLYRGDTRRMGFWNSIYTWEKHENELPKNEMIWRLELRGRDLSFSTNDWEKDKRYLGIHYEEVIAAKWITKDDKERWILESC